MRINLSKFYLIFTLAFMSALAPLSTDMYLPALSAVQQSFATNSFLTQLSLAVFFIAFSLGQLIYGPLSDIYGRKKPLYLGITLFMLASLGCVVFDNIYLFIFFRFLEALGGCAGVVIARAIVRDTFALKEAASVFALMMVISSLAPMLSPTFGGFLLDFFSWKSIFAFLFMLGVALLLWIIFALKETNLNATGDIYALAPKKILNNYFTILKDRRFKIYVFASSLGMASMFAYITGSSYVFTGFFGLSEKTFGILFGLNALSFMLFAQINAKLVLRYSPYFVLPYAFLAMLGIAILLLFVGYFNIGLTAFEILLFLMVGMLGFIVPNTTTLAMARFKQNAGSASALLGMIQFAVAGFIAFIVGFFNANTPLFLGIIIATCLLFACAIYFSLNKKEIKNFKKKFGF